MNYLVDFGPGHIDHKTDALSADVALNLEYLNLHPSDTRAVLHLYAEKVDLPGQAISIGIELTEGDIIALIGALASLLTALKQDEEEATWTTT